MKKPLLIIFSFLFIFLKVNSQQITQVTTFAGSGIAQYSEGTGTEASLNYTQSICGDAAGNLFVVDRLNFCIRKITPAGVVTTFAGSGKHGNIEGIGTGASMGSLWGICIDAFDNLYVTDYFYHKIWKITPGGAVTTLAGGNYSIGYNSQVNGDYADGKGLMAKFNMPAGICMMSGNLYVSDARNSKIRKVTTSGEVTTFANVPGIPQGICSDGINLFVSYLNLFLENNLISKITPSGNISVFAGQADNGSIDSTGTNARFSGPAGLCTDLNGNIYVADTYNNKIRKITPSGIVTTIAGNNSKGDTDASGIAASFYNPEGIYCDASGVIWVSDTRNNKIRKIEILPPAPPVVNYFNIQGSLCMGSTTNEVPATNGRTDLKLNLDSTSASAPKAICKGNNGDVFVVNANDSILRYDANGNLLQILNDPTVLINIKDIAVDSYNRVYAIADAGQTNSIYRLNPDGSWDAGFSSPMFFFSDPVAIALGPDGKIYVSDTTSGNISTVDTTSGVASAFAGPFEGLYNITDIDFGTNNIMYVVSKGYQKILSRQLGTSGNFVNVVPGIDTMGYEFDKLYIDTLGLGAFYISSASSNRIIELRGGERSINLGPQSISSLSISDISSVGFSSPKDVVVTYTTTGAPSLVVANAGGYNIKSVQVYLCTITPQLPAGLYFDAKTGRIIGTPNAPSPATEYSITVTNGLGSTTTKINFSVDPPGPVSNAVGTNSSKVQNHPDGFNINYFEKNNCAEMMSIEDAPGGNSLGNTQVNQTVYPTIATFSTGKFVPRVNEINSQDPNAEAHLKFYYTYLDIEHFNQSNGTDPDLDNDTIAGTMQVGILQLHTDSATGRTMQIKHNPITATWSTKKNVWMVDFAVDKLSTFYLGETSTIGTLDCSNAGTPENITACSNYLWRGISYSESGTYTDTTSNINGCDSVLTLNLTILNDFEIYQDGETLTCNTAGATYQWVNADNNYAVINGATSQTYVATTSGNYAVIATKNACTDTSGTVYVDIQNVSGTLTQVSFETVEVYPNPGSGVFMVKVPVEFQVSIISALGETIIEKQLEKGVNLIDLTNFTNGVYFIKFRSEDKIESKILIKR